ncbi:MAG: hypothetical protein WCJ36_01565 [Candidatus Saccharibacteria bacterium]
MKGAITVDVKYNVTGSERKALVGAISEILGREIIYKGAPTFAYTVSDYLIDKNGTLSCPDDNNREEVKRLLEALKQRGYTSETPCSEESDNPDKLSIQMPKADFTEEAIANLKKIIASKETLIKKALGANSLPVDIIGDTLSFPWFTLNGAVGEYDAYTLFVVSLCQMAKTQKRITAKEKELENDKFTMRLFLIRLGFVGPKYKIARTILLKDLTGNSSFKNGQCPNKTVIAKNSEAKVSAEDLSNTQTQNEELGGSLL